MNWAVIWAAITAIGTVLAGLALPLAFIQLGALRQDRLRAQVSKVGAWVEKSFEVGRGSGVWDIPLKIRNGSELPVRVDTVDVAVRPWGYERVLAAEEGSSEPREYADKRLGNWEQLYFAPGTVAPGDTWDMARSYVSKVAFDEPQPPMAVVTRVVITDAAGYQWDMRSGKAGPARRVQRWRRWRWKRHGNL